MNLVDSIATEAWQMRLPLRGGRPMAGRPNGIIVRFQPVWRAECAREVKALEGERAVGSQQELASD